MVQHAAVEPPGLIADVLRAEHWRIRLVRPYRREAVPTLLGSDRGLVVMGGPMSVYDGRCAFLEAERRLISDALERRRPVLGICLGSQLLAATLGAPVVPNLHRELGWHEIYFTPDATGDPLWRGLTEALTTFHWHGDRFGLPADAIPLAWSRLTECQAFRWGESAYGILFHLEVNQRMVTRMTRAFQAELLATGQSPTEIVNAGPTHLPVLERVGTEVFRRWARLLEG